MKPIQLISSSLLLTMILTSGCTQMMADHKAMGVPDLAFVRNAGYSQQDEIAAGQLAIEKTNNPDVKEFARTMINAHQKAYAQLKMIGEKLDLALPEMADPTHMQMAAQLSAYGSPVFEKEYIASQIADHSMVLEMFKAKYEATGDPALKEFLAAQIPVVEHHLSMARSLQKKLS